MVFNIKNLVCKYPEGPVVLRVPDLAIVRGEMVFIIGASGIGKSTFLEALGLMNRTIYPDTGADRPLQLTFLLESGATIELADIWSRPKDELADLRSQYFSFIFQQTNLFPHFTVGENMMMSDLIAGANQTDAKAKVRKVMQELDLDESLFDKRVVEVSGGQRQRLAFVRAFTAPFEVLLADEPTGNLDPVTSRKLMYILSDYLKRHFKTGLLVSHDIRLALEFADRIIPIVSARVGDAREGLIYSDEIIARQGDHWIFESTQAVVPDPAQLLWDHISKQV
jgi:ABC-type lipoprotein export system ATPase subunit